MAGALAALVTLLGAAAFLSLVVAASCRAQTTAAPATAAHDCNLNRRAFDNYLSDRSGFVAPRYVHESVHVGLSITTAELAHVLFKRGPMPSTAIGAVTIGVLPHARGLVQHRYPFDGPDVAADALIASVPLIAVTARSAHSWQGLALGATTILASVLAAACGASP